MITKINDIVESSIILGPEVNLFTAAINNDTDVLRECLSHDMSLDSKSEYWVGMTPIHLACIFGSNAFLNVAAQERKFDPWLRDDNGRVAFDHAAAKNNREAMRLLFGLMHPKAPSLEAS